MKISVIVPCRNEKRHMMPFLESLLAQDFEPGWEIEVLVADGGSDDGTAEMLRDYAMENPVVRVIDNPRRIVSTGLNAAIAAATGEVIVRMDVHTVYAPDYLRECLTALAVTGAENVGGPWVAVGSGTVASAIAAAFRSPFCTGGGKAHNPSYEGEVDTVYLGCWPRAVFDWIGLFDEDLVRNQDDEFNFRLRRAGGRVWQSRRIRSWYTPRASLGALFRQYMQYGYWKVAVIRKHRALASWRHLGPPLFAGSILLSILLIALAAAVGQPALATVIGAALALGLLVYALACIGGALSFANALDLPALLLLPVVIAIYHAGYGLGFLAGVLRPAPRGSESAGRWSPFTALTR